VTLNICLAGDAGIHQSADFRLSTADGRLYEFLPKAVLLCYHDWVGLITYAGIGRDPRGFSTTDWLTRTLSSQDAQPSFEGVLEVIRAEGTAWLRRISEKYRRHTFILGAIVRGKPRVAMVSNFQSIGGATQNYSDPVLRVTWSEPEDYARPLVAISGVVSAVKQYKTYLQRLYLDYPLSNAGSPDEKQENLKRIHKLIAGVNKRASKSKEGKQWISKQCIVFSLIPDVAGSCELNGGFPPGEDPVEDSFIEVITNGQLTTSEIVRVAKQQFPGTSFRFVGVSMKVEPVRGISAVMWALRPDRNLRS
jgi:hypothetical protein